MAYQMQLNMTERVLADMRFKDHLHSKTAAEGSTESAAYRLVTRNSNNCPQEVLH